MINSKKQKIINSSIGLIAAVLLFFSSGLKLPVIDEISGTYFRESITKAGVAYATCRVINASVSIIKDSTLQLEPAGVGVSLAVGQALDPIDDLTERLSDVIITAITSLGVQKLAYEISISLAPPVLAVFLLAFTIISWFESERVASLKKNLMRFIVIIVVARFCLPISSMANEYLHSHFFAGQISEANSELTIGSAELDKLKDFSLPEINGVLETIENSASIIKRKSAEFKNALVSTVANAGDIIKNLLRLTFLYVGIFLIQVIILPLLSFWFLAKTASSLFPINFPVKLNSSQMSNNDDTKNNSLSKE